jgi:hemerythrin-like metal-binding protein
MAFIEWQEHYETGLMGYDAQHKTLFRLANRIHECLERQVPGSDLEINSVFAAFLEMTRTHVRTEDELMAWHHHEPAKDHEEAHRHFIEGLEALADPSVSGLSQRERLSEILHKFKRHFEAEDEQTFLALLRHRNFPSAS